MAWPKWPCVSCTETTKWAGCTDTSTEIQITGGKMEDIPEYRRPDGKRGVLKASLVNNFPHGTSEWAFKQLPIDDCRHAFISATSISCRVVHLSIPLLSSADHMKYAQLIILLLC